MHKKLDNLVRTAHQPHKLVFRHPKGGIGHHIQKPNVQFPNILVQSLTQRQHVLAVLPQPVESRQGGMCN